jgi:hypothetical protein
MLPARPATTDRPGIGYAMIFPGMTIVKILFVDIVPAFFQRRSPRGPGPKTERTMTLENRGMRIHFVDGTTLAVSFPPQRENRAGREILFDEIIKRRLLVVAADGAVHVIPFENVKYISVYPQPAELDKSIIQGAVIEA